MAGSYPNSPSRRMALDGDGSILVARRTDGSVVTDEATGPEQANTQREDGQTTFWQIAGGSAPSMYCFWIFPELREIDGAHAGGRGSEHFTNFQTSVAASTPWGGTWVTQSATPGWVDNLALDGYRTVTSLAVSNIRATRFTTATNSSDQVGAYHIYGEISPGETPDKLLIIDENTGLEFVLPQDYGDIARGSSEDIEIRIRNDSAGLTANTVQYTAEDLTGGSGGWYTFTLPGLSVFAATQQITSIAPATTTGIITARRITPGTEDLLLHSARLYANTASWS